MQECVIYFNNCLLAMFEDDLPYHTRITPSMHLDTVGRYDFSGQLNSALIAHLKLDFIKYPRAPRSATTLFTSLTLNTSGAPLTTSNPHTWISLVTNPQ
ncbi:hypothetical protein Taro_046338 [Colocasia esculenta]|uniref:Uncharacterized protein n=1 Tax=Colocasia esculenta TaxID=4460 RepID=A0A843X604_COLES|nr:hypothetical protein [Colocasia esculenta]